jgi:hypothetical protein
MDRQMGGDPPEDGHALIDGVLQGGATRRERTDGAAAFHFDCCTLGPMVEDEREQECQRTDDRGDAPGMK